MSRILDATAVVLMRENGEIFWVRRSPELSFMGGFYAFPGGRVDREDADPALIETVEKTHPPNERYDLRFVTCALRELFEETGVLPCREGVEPHRLRSARRALLEKRQTFSGIVRSLGVTLDAGGFRYLGYRTTPPFSPKRFHAHFFLLFLPPGQEAEVWPGELAEGEWITPRGAIERWQRGEILVAPPTLSAIEKLERYPGTRGIEEHFQKEDLPVPRIELRPGIYMLPPPTPPPPPA
ncbi:MAG: NUDIX hydrolase, partial [Deltaproteobacteria bacterium]